MNLIDRINKRALGYVFQKNDGVVDFSIKSLKLNDKISLSEEALTCVAFDHSNTSNYLRLAAGCENGTVFVCFLDESNNCTLKSYEEIQVHKDCIYDIVWSLDGKYIYTACGDGTIGCILVLVETRMEPTHFEPKTDSQKCIALSPTDTNILASGSYYGTINIWDRRIQKNPDIIIRHAHSTKNIKSRRFVDSPSSKGIRSLVFQDSHHIISASSSSSIIKVWDLRRSYCIGSSLPLAKFCMEAPKPVTGYSSFALDPSIMRLYARAQNSTIQIFDVGNHKVNPVCSITGPKENNSFYIRTKLSPDRRYLATGSIRGGLKIWNVKTNQLVFSEGDEEDLVDKQVLGVDWMLTRDNKNIICGDFDEGEICLWTENFNNDPDLLKDPPPLHCTFSQLKIDQKSKRSKTPPPTPTVQNYVTESPTLNLPNFITDSSSHPVTKVPSTQKTKTPNGGNWLTSLSKEITPNRSTSDTMEKSGTGKKSRRRLHPSSPGVPITEFLLHYSKIPKLDSENKPPNS